MKMSKMTLPTVKLDLLSLENKSQEALLQVDLMLEKSNLSIEAELLIFMEEKILI